MPKFPECPELDAFVPDLHLPMLWRHDMPNDESQGQSIPWIRFLCFPLDLGYEKEGGRDWYYR